MGFRITNKGGYDQKNETRVVKLHIAAKDEKKSTKCIEIIHPCFHFFLHPQGSGIWKYMGKWVSTH